MAIAAIVIGTLLFLTSILVFWKTYQPPSCTDGKQNQDETGIDCGGSCPYLCVQENIPPTVLYALPLISTAGRTDIIAMVENKNIRAAARKVPYTIKLFDARGATMKEITGTVDLPPHTAMPIYVPRALEQDTVARVFIEIVPTMVAWYSLDQDSRILPTIEGKPFALPADKPRIEALVSNASIYPLSRVPLVAIVHDVLSNNVVAASATVVDVAAQSESTASFNWNEPFSSNNVRVVFYALTPLP